MRKTWFTDAGDCLVGDFLPRTKGSWWPDRDSKLLTQSSLGLAGWWNTLPLWTHRQEVRLGKLYGLCGNMHTHGNSEVITWPFSAHVASHLDLKELLDGSSLTDSCEVHTGPLDRSAKHQTMSCSDFVCLGPLGGFGMLGSAPVMFLASKAYEGADFAFGPEMLCFAFETTDICGA